MRIRYHEPLGDPDHAKDPLPENWRELEDQAGHFPENLGVVEEGKLYRSGIVFSKQIPNLQSEYGIQNIITLLEGDWLEDYYNDPQVTIHQFPVYERKELNRSLSTIVSLVDSLRDPSLVCCLKGKTRTGMVSAAYNISNGNKGKMGAIVESASFGNLNPSSYIDMLKFDTVINYSPQSYRNT